MELPAEVAPIIPDAKPKTPKKGKRRPKPVKPKDAESIEPEEILQKLVSDTPAMPDIPSDSPASPSEYISVDKDSIMS